MDYVQGRRRCGSIARSGEPSALWSLTGTQLFLGFEGTRTRFAEIPRCLVVSSGVRVVHPKYVLVAWLALTSGALVKPVSSVRCCSAHQTLRREHGRRSIELPEHMTRPCIDPPPISSASRASKAHSGQRLHVDAVPHPAVVGGEESPLRRRRNKIGQGSVRRQNGVQIGRAHHR